MMNEPQFYICKSGSPRYAVGNGKMPNGLQELAFVSSPLHAQTWPKEKAETIRAQYLLVRCTRKYSMPTLSLVKACQ